MDKEQKLKDKFGTSTGFKVPDGFFDQTYASIESKLGSYPEFRPSVPVSRWQKLRPYVYLAAMFAGIWCMMKVFTMTQDNVGMKIENLQMVQTVSLNNPPAQLAQVINQPDVSDELQIADQIDASAESDMELEQEVQKEFNDFQDFEDAFDYKFNDTYADINIDDILSKDAEVTAQISD